MNLFVTGLNLILEDWTYRSCISIDLLDPLQLDVEHAMRRLSSQRLSMECICLMTEIWML